VQEEHDYLHESQLLNYQPRSTEFLAREDGCDLGRRELDLLATASSRRVLVYSASLSLIRRSIRLCAIINIIEIPIADAVDHKSSHEFIDAPRPFLRIHVDSFARGFRRLFVFTLVRPCLFIEFIAIHSGFLA
jgi:hypothetical protein